MVLFTGYKSDNLSQLAMDAQNCAVLDSACSSTVCGQSWIDNYIDSLDSDERGKVLRTPSEKVFKFGAGEKQKSKETVSLPAFLAGPCGANKYGCCRLRYSAIALKGCNEESKG